MIRTAQISSHILVQGIFEGTAANGNIIVRVDGRCFEGKPVGA